MQKEVWLSIIANLIRKICMIRISQKSSSKFSKNYVERGGDIDEKISVKNCVLYDYAPYTTLQGSIVFEHGEIVKYALEKEADKSKELYLIGTDIHQIHGNYRYHFR